MIRPSVRARWLALGALLAAGSSGAAGCSCDSPDSPSGNGWGGIGAAPHGPTATGTWPEGSGLTGGGGEGGAEPCSKRIIPSFVPDGWEEFTDWTCRCRFYLPGSRAVLPEPIRWQRCPTSPNGIDCRVMVTDWSDSHWPITVDPTFGLAADGTPLLMLRRTTDEYRLHLVAEVDGEVRVAMMQQRLGDSSSGLGCWLDLGEVHEGKYIFGIKGDSLSGHYSYSPHVGAIGGDVDELRPRVLAHYEDGLEYNWSVSNQYYQRVSTLAEVFVTPWSGAPEIFVTSPPHDPEGLKGSHYLMVGESLFWTSATLYQRSVSAWDPVRGAHRLIDYHGDLTRGAADLGTDGRDMVWAYGEGKEPSAERYPTRWIMTAPFTTDPAALAPRIVRSQPDPVIWGYRFNVGCGYAAHEGGAANVLVVRLADGVSWFVPSVWGELSLFRPKGITCDEVFIFGDVAGQLTIARVRLDSLGPGTPSDAP